MKYKVLITPHSFGRGSKKPWDILAMGDCIITKKVLPRDINERDLIEIIKGFEGIIIGLERITKKVISGADRLKVISKHGTGTDNIDVKAAREKNIIVTNTPCVNARSVADLAVCMILSLARKTHLHYKEIDKKEEKKIIGMELYGKVLGIVGLGRIGEEVVKRACGFGMKIVYTDVNRKEEMEKRYCIEFMDLITLLKVSNFISLHIPLTDCTKSLIGKKELSVMREDIYVINTARAGIINEDALYYMLRDRKIAGAALDAYDNPLLAQLDNVIVLPHIGAYTYETIEEMGSICATDVVSVLHGDTPLFKVN